MRIWFVGVYGVWEGEQCPISCSMRVENLSKAIFMWSSGDNVFVSAYKLLLSMVLKTPVARAELWIGLSVLKTDFEADVRGLFNKD